MSAARRAAPDPGRRASQIAMISTASTRPPMENMNQRRTPTDLRSLAAAKACGVWLDRHFVGAASP